MKKLYFLVLFAMAFSTNAQIVNIPDANFKAKLLSASSSNQIAKTNTSANAGYVSIDTNGDGEIQISEALLIKYLNVSYSYISNLTGIEAFTNLTYLSCNNNSLTSLNIAQNTALTQLSCDSNNLTSLNVALNTALTYLDCSANSLTSLNVALNTALAYLDCSANNLTSLNITQNTALTYLNCSYNSLISLDVTQNTALTNLNCSTNNLTSLNVTQHTALTNLNCSTNNLTSLNVTQNTALTSLSCSATNLTSLNVTQNTALKYLYCYNNSLTSLNVTQNTALKYLYCSTNNLTSLNVTQNTALGILNCSANSLTSLDLTQNTALGMLYCFNNSLTSLNVSQNPALNYLNCYNNSLTSLDVTQQMTLRSLFCYNNNLQSLYIKNNNLIWSTSNNLNGISLNFSNNPNLHYICADEEDVAMVQQKIIDYGYAATCTVNSYCNFTPGGTFYTINGVNRFDGNSNGCDANDVGYPYLKYNVNDGTSNGNFIANETGNYFYAVHAATHTITPVLQNPSYFSISPTTISVAFPAQASPFSQNFCITPTGTHPDLEVAIIPLNAARPGFDASYKIFYKNNGNQLENTSITFAYNDAVLDFIGASQTPTAQSTGLLTFNVGAITPFLSGNVVVSFNLNAPTETPPLNGGDILSYTATANGLFTDETPADNTFGLNQLVVNSYDPNDKTCLEGETIDPNNIGKFVHYQIRFENTGTFPAQNVVVKDIIDTTKFDISTLQMVTASHSCVTRINGNKVEFVFENINLPFNDATNDGYVVFKIKTLPTLTVNSTISNTAQIYFDYNFPIVTNTATSTYQTLQTTGFEFTNEFVLYPNPAKNSITIQTKNETNINSVEVYNVLGQLVLVKPNFETVLDISQLNSGSYLIKLNTEKGITSTQFIKD